MLSTQAPFAHKKRKTKHKTNKSVYIIYSIHTENCS